MPMTESTVSKAVDEPGRPPDGGAPVLEAARSALDSYRLDYDWHDSEVVRVPDEAVIELIRFLAAQVTRRVQQIVPLAPPRIPADRSAPGHSSPWSFGTDAATVTNFAQAVSRSLAAQHRKVERIYVVPPGGAPAKEIEERVADDAKYGIVSCSLRFNELRPDPEQQSPYSHVWIVDDSAVMFQELTEEGPPNWTVSARKHGVEQAGQLWRELKGRSAAQPDREADTCVDLTESLLASADLLARTAPMSCTQGNARWEPCEWYHGSWQHLRLFNMVSSPLWHDEFYRNQLHRAIDTAYVRKLQHLSISRDAAPRILISGSADYSMFAYVVHALRETELLRASGRAAPVHIIDLCPTPLLACRWYSQHVKYPAKTHELDICGTWKIEDKFPRRFDLITTDAFLTRFSFEDCKKVLARWWDLLNPGGRVVTTVRLHGYDAPQTDRVQEIGEFVTRAREEARAWRPVLQTGVDAMCDSAREYARRITSTNLGGESEVRELFEMAGFNVLGDTKQSGVLTGELRETRYLRVVAEKHRDVGAATRSVVRGRRHSLTRKGETNAVERR
jgi:hypothetical protein